MDDELTVGSDGPGAAALPAAPYLFVSYASVDRAPVLAVADAVRNAGARLWIDQAGIAGGAAYGTEIAAALKESAAVLLMCSAASLASRNVRQEIMLAWRYERPILPLLLEPTVFPDDIAYWLEGAQWIELFERSDAAWLPALGRALARHGIRLDATTTVEAEPSPESPALALDVPGNLGGPAEPLIGRERELRELHVLAGHGRWVTLTGPGGTGKTALARELARRLAGSHPDGVWFVDLAAERDPAAILPAIHALLDVPDAPDLSPAAALAAALAGRSSLLLLDNLEQIPDAGAEIATLLEAVPGLRVIATSRVPLKGAGEWLYQVAPLEPPPADGGAAALARYPAVRLFVERARAVRADFVLSDGNAPAVAAIIGRLDGLPLAIELAAARVRLLPPAAILERLGSRLSLLTRGGALSERQRTLRGTIAWSYELLSPAEQAAFRRLAVFAGGASLEAAERVVIAVDGHDSGVLDQLEALIEQSLVRAEPNDIEEAPRLRLLETIREFAAEKLDEAGERAAAAAAHAIWLRDTIEAREPELNGPGSARAIRAIALDEENVRRGFAWLQREDAGAEEHDLALRLAVALSPYWARRGRFREARARLEAALAASASSDAQLRARAHDRAGYMANQLRDPVAALARATEAIATFDAAGDANGAADALGRLSFIHEDLGEFPAARAARQRELALRRRLGDELRTAGTIRAIALLDLQSGDYDEGIARLTAEVLPVARAHADPLGLADTLEVLGLLELYRARYDEALGHLSESLAIHRTLGDEYAIATLELDLARTLQEAGSNAEAAPLLERLEATFREHGERRLLSVACYALGRIALDRGAVEDARRAMLAGLEALNDRNDSWNLAELVEGLGLAEIAAGRPREGASLAGAAAAIRSRAGLAQPVPARRALDHWLQVAAEAIGEAELGRATDEGRRQPLETLLGGVPPAPPPGG